MPIGAFIGAAGNLIGSFMNEQSNDRRHKEALKAQQQENQLNRDWQEQMWEKHESPQAQVQNMLAAGLNPMGQVSSQSVGSASTSSLPTPPPSTIGDGIARAGESIASNLHARKQLKLQRDQYNQQVTEQNRRFLMDLGAQILTNEEKRVVIDTKIAELDNLNLDYDTKKLNYDMLVEFRDAGGNTYKDQSEQINASIALCKKEYEYYDQNQQLVAQEIKARINNMNASARASIESARFSKNSADSLVLDNTTKSMMTQISHVVGFDVSILPPGAQAEVCQIVKAVIDNRLSEQEAGSQLRDILSKLRRSETYIQGSYTYNVGALTAGASSTYNANEFVP